ncbi:hypothetical protein BAE44_0023842 [Dichanthelium oligosanthes]|uniref:Uncharacterized protein n=1 Tax=Dichanthelium oligosanthes TaxID=888268 RepID=A0A1E5UQK5_9POAL|nr:hypothetical protein BAE44_0023842 [Dichanthelium oligosanthes]
MEDYLAAASLMPHSHSAPLYLLYDLSGSFPKHGLAPVHDDDGGFDDGFEFATTTATARNGGAAAALRACASDVSAAAFADELLPLPPRLQRPSFSAGASAATSPIITSSSAAAAQHASSGRKHRGFDPFAAALEKVRRDGAGPRRARSLSPLHATAAAADASSAHERKSSGSSNSRAPRPAAQKKRASAAVAARRARRGVRHLLCRVAMASAAAVAPKALWPRRKDGVSYRPGLLVCLGYGV